MKVIIEPTEAMSDVEFQKQLDMNENFSLVDSIFWLMDYGEFKNGQAETKHNKVKITIKE